jgi:hypothetical protein
MLPSATCLHLINLAFLPFFKSSDLFDFLYYQYCGSHACNPIIMHIFSRSIFNSFLPLSYFVARIQNPSPFSRYGLTFVEVYHPTPFRLRSHRCTGVCTLRRSVSLSVLCIFVEYYDPTVTWPTTKGSEEECNIGICPWERQEIWCSYKQPCCWVTTSLRELKARCCKGEEA